MASTLGAFSCGGGENTPTPPHIVAAPTVSLSLSALTAYVGLDSVALTWSSQSATMCTAGGDWAGAQPTSGNLLVRPDTGRGAYTYTFTLSCSGPGGISQSSSVQLNAILLAHETCQNEHAENFWKQTSNAPVRMGEFLPVNSVGALDDHSIPNLQVCMSSTMRAPGVISASWTWRSDAPAVPFPPRYQNPPIFGYPSIGYGSFLLWQSGQSTTTTLPAMLATLPDSLIVSFALDVKATGRVNTLIDMNVTSTVVPDPCHQTEVMVITYAQGYDAGVGDTDLWPVAVRAGGHSFTVRPYGTLRPSPTCPNDPTSWMQLIQALITTPLLEGAIPLKPLFDYLISRGAFRSDAYLQLVYFGTEIGWGAGTASLKRYAIRAK